MALTVLEKLQDIAFLQSIEINRYALPERLRGLYFEENSYRTITINTSVDTEAEEVDIMAEEISHSVVGGGDLLFNNKIDEVIKRKAELRSKNNAYNLVVPAKKLLYYLKQQLELWEIAEEFSCTEKFVSEAIEAYKCKGLIPQFIDCEYYL